MLEAVVFILLLNHNGSHGSRSQHPEFSRCSNTPIDSDNAAVIRKIHVQNSMTTFDRLLEQRQH